MSRKSLSIHSVGDASHKSEASKLFIKIKEENAIKRPDFETESLKKRLML